MTENFAQQKSNKRKLQPLKSNLKIINTNVGLLKTQNLIRFTKTNTKKTANCLW